MKGLRKIRVNQLALGMYLVKFDGGWLASPFWTNEFLLNKQEDLDRALSSDVKSCWINTELGADLAPPSKPAPRPAPVDPGRRRARAAPVVQPVSFAAEMATAQSLCATASTAVATIFDQTRLGKALDVAASGVLVQEIVNSVERHPTALISLSRIKTSDDYTYMHSVAVCALMVALAKAMKLPPDEVREAGLGGLLHDIGKAKISLDILNKPAALDENEFAAIKRHPEHAYEALQNDSASEAVRLTCLHHHERVDGGGYPAGLAGQAIPVMARMAAVCDVYDAVTSDRPYKRGWDPAEALSKMISWSGHFDPAILAAFVDVVGIYPSGSLVRLSDQRLAVVVEQNRAALTKPLVRTFYCSAKAQLIPVQEVDLAAPGAPLLVGRETRAPWPTELIERLWRGDAPAPAPAPAA